MAQCVHQRLSLLFVLLMAVSCKEKQPAPAIAESKQPALFQLMQPDSTGITFANFVNDTGAVTVFNNLYMYNGGGVAIGDINNDGLQDIFFSANQLNSSLYLNLGNFRFKEIAGSAGINTTGGWTTGAVMADVNGDGWMDIYVCRGGSEATGSSSNLLFVNKGTLTFKESAAEYGIDDSGFSSQASFFDYDNDGDLDLYVMNYPEFKNDPLNFYSHAISQEDYPFTDHLYENVDGKFTDVTLQSGLPIEKGYGLGLVVSDLNQDGWSDIYVANDWAMPDYLYINIGNKKFENQITRYFTKNAFFSMGIDVADLNNDALTDIAVSDMVPASHERRHIHISQAPIDYFFLAEKLGGILQHSRNVIQIARQGGGYTDISEFAGTAKTDWSWSSLLCDFDNDGWKDLFITNGMKRDEGDMDYERLMFDEQDTTVHRRSDIDLIHGMKKTLLSNYIFKNKTGCTFEKSMKAWGVDQLVNTQGAAYADLDNDGNVDLILNNVDTVAFLYRNTGMSVASPLLGETQRGNSASGEYPFVFPLKGETPARGETQRGNYLRLAIKGEGKNTLGLGTKAWLYSNGKAQYAELSNARGFQSSSEPALHFGLGNNTLIDSVVVVFPSSKYTVLKNVKAGQQLILEEKNAEGRQYNYRRKEYVHQLFIPQTKQIIPAFVHRENDFNDFKRDKLIPRMFSKEGPALATGDLNGDGLDDFYVGGAAGQSGAAYLQNKRGEFTIHPTPDILADSSFEDASALIADFNSDGKNDLYVVSGSNEFNFNSPLYQDRIYLNDAKGNLKKCNDCLPQLFNSKSCIAARDYDKDGDLDLFVGGRTVPGSYGKIPRSYLLENDKGKFKDVTGEIAPSLAHAGMLTDAQWADIDGDNIAELILSGDWMPVSVFKYAGGKFENITSQTGLQPFSGWWNCITLADVDGDGDNDIAAGNWGLNSILKAAQQEPLTLLVNDFDGNGSVDPILCCFLQGENGAFLGRDLICRSMPKYFNKFHTYESFARAKVEDLFSKELYEKAEKLYSREMRSCIFINDGKGKFEMKPLPDECQFAPVNKILAHDFTGDAHPDLLLLGNTNQNYYDQGDIDALQGVLLRGDGAGNFSVAPYRDCGLNIRQFVRSAAIIGNSMLAGCNDDSLRIFLLKTD